MAIFKWIWLFLLLSFISGCGCDCNCFGKPGNTVFIGRVKSNAFWNGTFPGLDVSHLPKINPMICIHSEHRNTPDTIYDLRLGCDNVNAGIDSNNLYLYSDILPDRVAVFGSDTFILKYPNGVVDTFTFRYHSGGSGCSPTATELRSASRNTKKAVIRSNSEMIFE